MNFFRSDLLHFSLKCLALFIRNDLITVNNEGAITVIVHSLSSGKVEMFLCAACHAFTPHVNAWKR